jgi:hypothetical protein
MWPVVAPTAQSNGYQYYVLPFHLVTFRIIRKIWVPELMEGKHLSHHGSRGIRVVTFSVPSYLCFSTFFRKKKKAARMSTSTVTSEYKEMIESPRMIQYSLERVTQELPFGDTKLLTRFLFSFKFKFSQLC